MDLVTAISVMANMTRVWGYTRKPCGIKGNKKNKKIDMYISSIKSLTRFVEYVKNC